MKAATTLLLATVLYILLPGHVQAQCTVQTTTNYAVSYSVGVNGTGTDILTSVLLDGNSTMSMSTAGCPDSVVTQFNNNKQYIQHWPSVQNLVGSVGGWSQGPAACAECYISYQTNEDSGPLDPSGQLPFTYNGQTYCGTAGIVFFPPPIIHTLSIGKVNFILENYDSSNCYYMQWCPNGNVGLSSCVANFHFFTAYGGVNPRTKCWTYNYAWEFFLVVDGTCVPVGISVLANSPINCQ